MGRSGKDSRYAADGKERGMTIKLTREEAIQDLEAIKSFERYARGRLALDIAIEALKAQDRPIICPRCGRTFAESEGRE